MDILLFILWFFLPAGIANMAPVFAAHIPFLKPYIYPMDFHKTFRGKRIFGTHKTFRGLAAGIFLSILTVMFQQFLYEIVPSIRLLSPINYREINTVLFGTLCALGALLGDAVKSFFKRQLNVAPGKAWFPFDQIDYILGTIAATYFYIPLPIQLYALIIVVYFSLHILSTYLGFVLGLKEKPI